MRDYQIGPEDVLEISVWKEEGLKKEVLVRPDGGIWTEPVQGGYPDPRMFLSLSGLEVMRGFIRGLGPAPPISYLTGMRPTQVGPGTATFSMPVTGWLLSPPGLAQLGTLAILALYWLVVGAGGGEEEGRACIRAVGNALCGVP